MNIMDRFYKKIIPVPESGCWLWMGATNQLGYGSFFVAGRVLKAHRFSYETFVGPLVEGLCIDHLCRVRCCVNPSHLELVTNRVNALRGSGWAAFLAAKTHCKRGHEFTKDNTYVYSYRPNRRNCRACRADRYWENRTAKLASRTITA